MKKIIILIIQKLAHLISKDYYIMSVYKDDSGQLFGGVIHKDDGKSYIDDVSHVKNPKFLGVTKVYFK